MHLAVADAIEARAVVRTLAKVGVDFIKIHLTLTREQYDAIIDESKKVGLPVAGHIPSRNTPEEVSDAGEASIEHTESLFQGTFDMRTPREQMIANMDLLFQRFAKNNTFYTPTLIMYKSSADFRGLKPDPQTKYVAKSAFEVMTKAAETIKKYPDIVPGRLKVFGDLKMLVGMMRKNGVKVMVGTDLADGRIFPGYSVHEEMELLVESGFTADEAIQAATRVPTEYLRLKDSGVIRPGNRADFILLNANPLSDIRNTRKIESVVACGRLFNRLDLDQVLKNAEQMAVNH